MIDQKLINAIERSTPQEWEKVIGVNKNTLSDYNPEMTSEEFKERYAGLYQKDTGKRMSKASMSRIWNKFVREERIDFFKAHTTFTIEDVLAVGIDKFIYTLGWTKPAHVRRWRNNKVRIGLCCHCNNQFIPLMFQTNHGMCNKCRPLYSVKAMKNFVLRELNTSERYHEAHRDMLMDFYIMFYHDKNLRKLFLKDSDMAKELENIEITLPDWIGNKKQDLNDVIEAEFTEVIDDGESAN